MEFQLPSPVREMKQVLTLLCLATRLALPCTICIQIIGKFCIALRRTPRFAASIQLGAFEALDIQGACGPYDAFDSSR